MHSATAVATKTRAAVAAAPPAPLACWVDPAAMGTGSASAMVAEVATRLIASQQNVHVKLAAGSRIFAAAAIAERIVVDRLALGRRQPEPPTCSENHDD